MSVIRIVPNISSSNLDECKKFYSDFLGLNLTMDLGWILTFTSPSNTQVQVSIVKKNKPSKENTNITITIEIEDIEIVYEAAILHQYPIIYPLTEEHWGVRRFFVKDPNGVTINLMCHT